MRFWVRASGRLELEIIDDHNGVKIPARENNGFTNIHSTNGAMHEHGLFLYVNKAEQVDMI